jgi:hypothetical protein
LLKPTQRFSSQDFPTKEAEKIQKTQFIYLHRYLYGGATTFTAHLIHKLGIFSKSSCRENNNTYDAIMPNRNAILRCGKISERKLREFGYGLYYQNVSPSVLAKIRYPFLTIFNEDYFFNTLVELNRGQRDRLKDSILVIHDYRDVSDKVAPYLKNWRLIAIRKTVQEYMRSRLLVR